MERLWIVGCFVIMGSSRNEFPIYGFATEQSLLNPYEFECVEGELLREPA